MSSFIITVDTEGDNLWKWHEGDKITTENTRFIPRFQNLCEEFGFKPVYLTNYEMAQDDEWVRYARKKAAQGMCEVGMHIHAWNSPPEFDLKNNFGGNPYITEYPSDTIFQKIEYITNYLTERFGTSVTSARSGRWATNKDYFAALAQNGYICDCSYTPEIDLSRIPGHSANIGNDYRQVNKAVHIAENGIVEVPMSTRKIHHIAEGTLKHKLSTLIKGDSMWLRPYRKSLSDMLFLSQAIKKEGENYLEFMIHSSELMPGGSPYFKSDDEIEILYSIMRQYFQWVAKEGYKGISLSSYASQWKKQMESGIKHD